MAIKTGPYPGSGKAHPSNQIIDGLARFTILSSGLIRMEYAPSGAFEDRCSYFAVQRDAAPQPFKHTQASASTVIETARLRLTYQSNAGPFSPQNLSIKLLTSPSTVEWKPGMPETGNLGGTIRTLDECIGPMDLGLGLLSRDGWHLQDDSSTVLFSEEDEPWAVARPSGQLDWYFFGYGQDYAAALKDLSSLGGKIPLPPRFSLGSWYSRYWPYSSAEFLEIAQEYKQHRFPLDVMVIDMDWHEAGWTGYSWNKGLIPDPPALLAQLHAQGLKTTLNLHPHDGVGTHESAYAAFAAAMGADLSKPVAFDITDKKFAENYFKLLLNPLEEQGVDFWWMDWQQGKSSAIEGLDPLMWLNALHFRDRERERGSGATPLRGMNFSRWSGWGDQRHPVHFSGDTDSNWEVLEFLVPFTSTAGNVGCAYWSHDIGGHFSSEGRIDPERYLRWLQFGAFSPVLRVHSSRDKDNDRRPWLYGPDFEAAARKAYALRAKLVPYFYAASRACYDSGMAPLRPMYLAYPNEDVAYHCPGQFMLGNDLLVAPATRPGFGAKKVVHVPIWFPAGDWYHLETHERFSGPLHSMLAVPLDGMAVFARAGAIIPMNESETSKAAIQADHLVLRIYPGPASSQEHYEDDGESVAYRDGAFRKTRLSQAGLKSGQMELSVGPSLGSYEGAAMNKPRMIVEMPRLAGLSRTEIAAQDLSATDSLALKGDWEGAAVDCFYQALSLSQRVGLALAQLDSKQQRYAQLEALVKVLEGHLAKPGVTPAQVSLAQAQVDALIFELSEDGSPAGAQDALRVLAGISLQAMAVPGNDNAHFEVEVELRREAAWLSQEGGSAVLSCEVPSIGTVKSTWKLELQGIMILRQEFAVASHAISVIQGQAQVELSYKGKLIRLVEPFAWKATGIREWLVLGPLPQGQGPEPASEIADLDLSLGWIFKRFDPKRVVRGIREVYTYGNSFKCPKGHCFAVAILESCKDESVSFGFWHAGKAKLWINGQECYQPGTAKFEAPVRKGENLVFVRLDNIAKDGAGFHLSAEEAKGSAPHLKFRAPSSQDPKSHPVSSNS